MAGSGIIDHPAHYTGHAVECISLSGLYGFHWGNVIKYAYRADGKNGLEDWAKARWYAHDATGRGIPCTPSDPTEAGRLLTRLAEDPTCTGTRDIWTAFRMQDPLQVLHAIDAHCICAWPGCHGHADNGMWCKEHAPYARRVTFPTLTAFHPSRQRLDKWQALKILEEASETMEAAKRYLKGHGKRMQVAEESIDLLQTLTNLMDAYGMTDGELQDAARTVTERNTRRGRYQQGVRESMEGRD